MRGFIAVLLILAACSTDPRRRPLPPEPPPVSRVPAGEPLAALLAELDRSVDDVAYLSLLMGRVLDPAIDLDGLMRQVDRMTAEARPYSRPLDEPWVKAEGVSRYLFGNVRAVVPEKGEGLEISPKHRWLHQLLSSGEGQSPSLVTLFIAIGRRLGIPVQAAIGPQHAWVRVGNVNFETLLNGRSEPDDWYERWLGAKRDGTQFRSLTPKEFVAWLLAGLANDLLEANRPAEAQRCGDRAIAMFPELPEPHIVRGAAFQRAGKLDEALACYERTLELEPGNLEAGRNQVLVLVELKRFPDALAAVDRLLEHRPHHAGLLAAKARILMETGKVDEGRELGKRALRMDKGDPDAMAAHGEALTQERHFEQAVEAFDKALKLRPRDPRIWFNRGLALWGLNRHEDALASHSKALELNPKYGPALAGRALALSMLKRYDEALLAADKAITADPGEGRAWLAQGMAYAGRKQIDKSVESLERAKALGVSMAGQILKEWRESGLIPK